MPELLLISSRVDIRLVIYVIRLAGWLQHCNLSFSLSTTGSSQLDLARSSAKWQTEQPLFVAWDSWMQMN